ncbi:TPA: hypothetical protein ACSPXM_001503 [Campylobacter jejuni]
MKKMSKHIVLSFAVSSLLFSQAYALPSGGGVNLLMVQVGLSIPLAIL